VSIVKTWQGGGGQAGGADKQLEMPVAVSPTSCSAYLNEIFA
jgi:hypothetical protein